MFKNNRLFKRILLLCIALLAAIAFWGGLTPKIALSQQVESRLSNLETDVRNLESQLNQIESQLGRSPRSPRVTTPSPGDRGRQLLNREQMFDRLATLVIELKQQVNQLEARVSQLEAQKAPGKKL